LDRDLARWNGRSRERARSGDNHHRPVAPARRRRLDGRSGRGRCGGGARAVTRICKLLILLTLLGFASACSVSVRPVDDEATPTATAGTSGRVGSVRSTPVASVTVTPQPSGDTPVAAEVSGTRTPTTAGEVPTLPPPPTARPMPTMPPNPAPSPSPTPTARPEPTAPPPVTPTPAGPPVCAELPVRGFGLVWHDQPAVARQIGCPVRSEEHTSELQSRENLVC